MISVKEEPLTSHPPTHSLPPVSDVQRSRRRRRDHIIIEMTRNTVRDQRFAFNDKFIQIEYKKHIISTRQAAEEGELEAGEGGRGFSG